MKVNIKKVVENLSSRITFLDPLYECVSNSLEANATIINIELYESEVLSNQFLGNICGFKITDNGEGFTKKNLDAFSECYTENKIEHGCKGLGRFTRLKVFEDVSIYSLLRSENKKINFKFDYNFDEEIYISKEDCFNISENQTVIEMKKITPLFFGNKKGEVIADVNDIKEKILKKFFIKLYFLKQNNVNFKICIKNNNDVAFLSTKDIGAIEQRKIEIYGEDEEVYYFNLYYYFLEDALGTREMFLCGGERVVKSLEKEKNTNFTLSLPNSTSFICFVTGKYLDEKINVERNDFDFADDSHELDLINPIPRNVLMKKIGKEIKDIILNKFPSVKEMSKKEMQKAIDDAPFLKNYIEKEDNLLNDSKTIKELAEKNFERDKKDVTKKYKALLNQHNIDAEDFIRDTEAYSEIASIELGHYIYYRDAIIKGLKKLLDANSLKEEIFHDILIKKRTSVNNGEYLKTNLWLIDDKYMSFLRAFSDKSVSKINKELFNSKEKLNAYLKRPDVFLLFNYEEGNTDAIVIELKGSNCTKDEKNKSITELPNNIDELRECMNNLNSIYGYIITNIDEDFGRALRNQDFTSFIYINESKRSYYKYFTNTKSHIYVYDYENLIKQADERNNLFINILKGSYKK